MLFSLPVQVPLDPPKLHRIYKKKQSDRYSMVVDTEDDQGVAHYAFDVKLSVEPTPEDAVSTTIGAAFLNLQAKIEDHDLPKRRTFGVATYHFAPTGFPTNLALAGPGETFVSPLLSWYLPSVDVEKGKTFPIPDTAFEDDIHVSGSGTLTELEDASATLKLVLVVKSVQSGEFRSTSVFDRKTGTLTTAEGTLKSPHRLVSFKVKHEKS